MNNAPAILKSLIVYAICVPLAIWLGYLTTDPMTRPTLTIAGILVLMLCIPLLLRWHYFLMIFSWNLSLVVFFIQGSPAIWMPMVALSFGISILQRTLNSDMRFISAPQIAMPLLCLAVVVVVTAKLTGGIGLRSMGGDVMGGKRYIFLLTGILGYFALTTWRIPPQRAGLCVALFFLGSCASVIGDLFSVVPSSLYFIFWFFPPDSSAMGGIDGAIPRLGGVSVMASAMFSLLLAKYGVRGIFLEGRPWRLFLFALFFVLTLFGGFRSMVIGCVMIFFIQFFLEGMHRTKLLPALVMAGILMGVACIPLAGKLPYTFQRSLAFLPLNIDTSVRMGADASASWRWQMASAVWRQVPDYLLLGKGYALSQSDFQAMDQSTHAVSETDWGAAIASDFHNGPLSVIVPFGIWGVIAFLWLLVAGVLALRNNYRHGDPALRTINTLLLSVFLTKAIIFCSPIFGSLYSDMVGFAGLLGLSVALNGGICRPLPLPGRTLKPLPDASPLRPQLPPGFSRPVTRIAGTP